MQRSGIHCLWRSVFNQEMGNEKPNPNFGLSFYTAAQFTAGRSTILRRSTSLYGNVLKLMNCSFKCVENPKCHTKVSPEFVLSGSVMDGVIETAWAYIFPAASEAEGKSKYDLAERKSDPQILQAAACSNISGPLFGA